MSTTRMPIALTRPLCVWRNMQEFTMGLYVPSICRDLREPQFVLSKMRIPMLLTNAKSL